MCYPVIGDESTGGATVYANVLGSLQKYGLLAMTSSPSNSEHATFSYLSIPGFGRLHRCHNRVMQAIELLRSRWQRHSRWVDLLERHMATVQTRLKEATIFMGKQFRPSKFVLPCRQQLDEAYVSCDQLSTLQIFSINLSINSMLSICYLTVLPYHSFIRATMFNNRGSQIRWVRSIFYW